MLSSVLEDQADVGEVEDQPNRAAVIGQCRQDLVGDLTNRALVEEMAIVEPDHLNTVDLTHLDPGSDGHRSVPAINPRARSEW